MIAIRPHRASPTELPLGARPRRLRGDVDHDLKPLRATHHRSTFRVHNRGDQARVSRKNGSSSVRCRLLSPKRDGCCAATTGFRNGDHGATTFTVRSAKNVESGRTVTPIYACPSPTPRIVAVLSAETRMRATVVSLDTHSRVLPSGTVGHSVPSAAAADKISATSSISPPSGSLRSPDFPGDVKKIGERVHGIAKGLHATTTTTASIPVNRRNRTEIIRQPVNLIGHGYRSPRMAPPLSCVQSGSQRQRTTSDPHAIPPPTRSAGASDMHRPSEGDRGRADRDLAGGELDETEYLFKCCGLGLEIRWNLDGGEEVPVAVEHIPVAVLRLKLRRVAP